MSESTMRLIPFTEPVYGLLAPNPTISFAEREAVFTTVHPGATEYAITTERGLEQAARAEIKGLVLDNSLEESIYAGLNGAPLARNGRLIDPHDESAQRFRQSFYATSRTHWNSEGREVYIGDMDPIKHAFIKGELRQPGHAAFITFDRMAVEPTEDVGPESVAWKPKHGQTTESVVRAIFHVLNFSRF